jgi:hypothetical protein
MKLKGPIITLAAGVVVATVLMILNLSATPKKAGESKAAGDNQPAATATTSTPAAAPVATTAPPANAQPITYAGTIGSGNATLAIVIKSGTAVAYVCDGKSAEAWLQGTATDGTLSLTGAKDARLLGTYGNGETAGTVTAAGRQWTFSLKTVAPPSGLYRASANVRNAQVVGGWIVLPNGQQVGLVDYGDTTIAAPALNTTTKTTTVDNTVIDVTPVDGSGL